jgi:hypothetical protein
VTSKTTLVSTLPTLINCQEEPHNAQLNKLPVPQLLVPRNVLPLISDLALTQLSSSLKDLRAVTKLLSLPTTRLTSTMAPP